MTGQVMIYEEQDLQSSWDMRNYEFLLTADTDNVYLTDDGLYAVDVEGEYKFNDGTGFHDMAYDFRLVLDPINQKLHLIDQNRDAELFAMQYVSEFVDYNLAEAFDNVYNMMLAYDNDLDFVFDYMGDQAVYMYIQNVTFSAFVVDSPAMAVPTPETIGVLGACGLLTMRRRR